MISRCCKRNWEEAFTPWRREPKDAPYYPEMLRHATCLNPERQPFNLYSQNWHLDVSTKRACLIASPFGSGCGFPWEFPKIASPSIVSLQSYSGGDELIQCSGTISESVSTYSIILTTASLLRCSTGRNSVADDIKIIVHLSDGRSFDGQIEAYDFYYNIAAIKIQSDTPLRVASLTNLNDSITLGATEEKSFQLRPHSTSFDIIPGDPVIALGRYFVSPYDIMASPGVFSVDRCDSGCKEIFMTTCRISRCGSGGPLINRFGEVIGICLHDTYSTTFLPINIASIWWEHYKKNGQPRRPWLGMEVINLYLAPIKILGRITQKFPDVLNGVIVEEVVPGSAAESAGIEDNDVIIQFGGKRIESFLEILENMWNNVGESVELTVIRTSADVPLHLSMKVDEATSDDEF